MTTIDVCIATFRRPSLDATLGTLAAQRLPDGVTMSVIVADNDDTDAARSHILHVGRALGLSLTYCHAPARNISIARNATLDAATGEWVAILDDDETAAPNWLATLLAKGEERGADVVLGPVVARYGADAPDWMVRGDFHSAAPVFVNGTIQTGYTSNVMFRRTAPALSGLRFRHDLGRSGGEDTEFFHRAFRRGARIDAADAPVMEVVEPGRLTLRWLARRRFRSGQSHAITLALDAGGRPGPLAFVPPFAKAVVSAAGVLASLPLPRWRAFWLLRLALHAGVVAGLAGASPLVQYGGTTHAQR